MDWEKELDGIFWQQPSVLDKLNKFFGTNVSLEHVEQLKQEITIVCSSAFIVTLAGNALESTMPLTDESYGKALFLMLQLGMLCGYLAKHRPRFVD